MAEKKIDVRRLLEAFFTVRNVTVTGDSLRMWIDALGGLSEQQIEQAIRRYNRECSDYPTPAKLRSYASGSAALSDEQRAQVAWGSVRSTVLKYGAYWAIKFDDPIIHAAIRQIGGWVNLCNTQHDEMHWKQKGFCAAYVEIARHGIGDGRPVSGMMTNGAAPVDVAVGLTKHSAQNSLTYAPCAQSQQSLIPDLSIGR